MAEPSPRRISRRDVLRGLLLGSAGLVGVAACGVPSSGKPHIDGDGPAAGLQVGSNANAVVADPAGITDPQLFVRTFLTALAGPSDDQSRAAAIAFAKKFLTPEAQNAWQADPKQLTIVRATVGAPAYGEDTKIIVDLQQVGQLTAGGWVNPTPLAATKAEFHLVQQGPSGWLISSLPQTLTNNLLLSSDGLSTLYQPHLVYYWDAAPTSGGGGVPDGLVPDLRYLPLVGLKAEQQPTQIVNWLISGPSEWLAPAVTALPANTSLVLPNVGKSENSWVVDFANLPDNVDPARVASQLQWSLRPNFTEPVTVQIASQDKSIDPNNYMNANLADSPARAAAADPTRYFVVGGQVREAQSPYPVPPVFAKVNDTGLVSAAISRDLRCGAVVVKAGKGGKHQLRIGRRVNDAAQDADLTVVEVPGGASISRPVWLNLSTPRLLCASDNQLFSVVLGAQRAVQVPVAIDGGSSLPVTAFSVSPDGRRIALISGGRAAVAPLTFTADTVIVGTPYFIDSGGLTDLTAVAWSRVHCLTLAGKVPDAFGLVEVNLDGAISTTTYSRRFTSPVTQLVCSPPLPSSFKGLGGPGPIMVESQGSAWDNGGPMSYTPPPSDQPSGTTPQPSNATPIAPFYAD
jgi:Lipoprotein LpqB beta-propeller domain/Sporulation and spore germination